MNTKHPCPVCQGTVQLAREGKRDVRYFAQCIAVDCGVRGPRRASGIYALEAFTRLMLRPIENPCRKLEPFELERRPVPAELSGNDVDHDYEEGGKVW